MFSAFRCAASVRMMSTTRQNNTARISPHTVNPNAGQQKSRPEAAGRNLDSYFLRKDVLAEQKSTTSKRIHPTTPLAISASAVRLLKSALKIAHIFPVYAHRGYKGGIRKTERNPNCRNIYYHSSSGRNL